MELEETSISKINKGNLNSILVIMIEDIIIDLFPTMLGNRYVSKSNNPILGVCMLLYDPIP